MSRIGAASSRMPRAYCPWCGRRGGLEFGSAGTRFKLRAGYAGPREYGGDGPVRTGRSLIAMWNIRAGFPGPASREGEPIAWRYLPLYLHAELSTAPEAPESIVSGKRGCRQALPSYSEKFRRLCLFGGVSGTAIFRPQAAKVIRLPRKFPESWLTCAVAPKSWPDRMRKAARPKARAARQRNARDRRNFGDAPAIGGEASRSSGGLLAATLCGGSTGEWTRTRTESPHGLGGRRKRRLLRFIIARISRRPGSPHTN